MITTDTEQGERDRDAFVAVTGESSGWLAPSAWQSRSKAKDGVDLY